MDTIKFRKIGNSVGATFPQEYLKHLGVESGDEVFIIKEADGRIVLTTYDPDFAATMEAYKKVKKRYRNTLKTLADE
ncbi:AbrB/MazE/SpoVT family DNA-binding domain-containing protein [Rivularia sp. UHCC 0363]|uniref:AbrB/MazE/SpoVT family DNA-binding domain-containing protein n=1 Tax=Rivularia sp. UHCC 0363 TaxID=3110244 RepID=UPI002B1FA034|nr:AbrB/MazE/SpoVT family DNA-binding domain-containing protein [Rivularia sp. UHCC 0363]MEA5593442.1 AbrB/MazE/SpoVT family DNA-binding domain-containing protein [Rivularia sp. UHCC 0363]